MSGDNKILADNLSISPNGFNRDSRIDSLKGLLILLVVIGHMIEYHISVKANLYVYLLIYSFHMPLFVMISGYVFKPSLSLQKLWSSSLLLFETFVVFQLIECFLIWEDNGYCNFDLMNIIRPQKVLWYLVSLIVWRVWAFLIYKAVKPTMHHQAIVMATAVVAALLAGFVPLGNEFSFQRTFVYFPMFLMGYWFRIANTHNSLGIKMLTGGDNFCLSVGNSRTYGYQY